MNGAHGIGLVSIVFGLAIGAASGWGVHALFRTARPKPPLAVVALGWLAFACALVVAFGFAGTYVNARPSADYTKAFAVGAVFLCGLVGACAGLAALHAVRYRMRWFAAFGVLMAEMGAAFIAALFLVLVTHNAGAIATLLPPLVAGGVEPLLLRRPSSL